MLVIVRKKNYFLILFSHLHSSLPLRERQLQDFTWNSTFLQAFLRFIHFKQLISVKMKLLISSSFQCRVEQLRRNIKKSFNNYNHHFSYILQTRRIFILCSTFHFQQIFKVVFFRPNARASRKEDFIECLKFPQLWTLLSWKIASI